MRYLSLLTIFALLLASTVTWASEDDDHHNDEGHEDLAAHSHTREPGTYHAFVLGLHFEAIATDGNEDVEPSVDVEHIDPMLGYELTHCGELGCLATTLAVGIGVDRSYLPSYLLAFHLSLEDSPLWVGLELEGHLDDDEDEGIHTHAPNSTVSVGVDLPHGFHVGSGVGVFFAGENLGYAIGLPLIVGWGTGPVHLHAQVSASSSLNPSGSFVSRMGLHLSVAVP